MKYDSQLTELKNILPTAKNILIALPANANIDQLASGLALFLTLQGAGKQVSVACDDTIKVGQSHLFGVDHVQKNVPSTEGGNLTLTLEGVAASDNTIPALEKLDWYAENSNLNLVFHIIPGQTFQPAKIVPRFQGSGFNLIFVVGAVNLNALGNVYSQNQQAFSGTHVINIDTQSANTSFGQTNVLDVQASCVSEVMINVLTDLGFALNADSASNLMVGIFDSTQNLTDNKTTAETYMAVANCLRVGGKKPSATQASTPSYDWSALMPASTAQRGEPKDSAATVTPTSVQPVAAQPSDFAKASSDTQTPVIPEYAMPSVAQATEAQVSDNLGDDSASATPVTTPIDQPSPEERPYNEGVVSETVEPEWLTPKIFKGSSLG